jgi:serine/threonine-protein kinase
MAEVERELATVMGPIAKAIVRQAARTATDADSLRQAVAQHIPDATERAQFISGTPAPKTARGTLFGSKPATPVPAPRTGGGTGGTAGSAGDAPLSEAMVAAALPLVVDIMGPIAKVLLKKAAARAATKQQFVQAVASLVDPADQARVAEALQRL